MLHRALSGSFHSQLVLLRVPALRGAGEDPLLSKCLVTAVAVGIGPGTAAAPRSELGVGWAVGGEGPKKGRGAAEHVERRPDRGVGGGLGRRAAGAPAAWAWAWAAGLVLSGRLCGRKRWNVGGPRVSPLCVGPERVCVFF